VKLLRWLGTAFDRLLGGLAFIGGILLACLLLLIVYEVAMRYVFRSPPSWYIEVSQYLLVFVLFLTTGFLLKEGGHIQVDILYERMNPKNRLSLDIIVSVVSLIISMLLLVVSSASVVDCFQRNAFDAGILKVPKGFLLVIIPIGFIMLTLEFARKTFKYLRQLISGSQNKIHEERQ
jgi:TRAP-type C4-dicarboxylate transport system permease small subunit